MQLKLAMLYCVCAAFWLSPAMAQQRANANPADPRAEVPTTRYQSAFTGYQSFRDEKPAPWREVNDEAGRVGGHLGIFGGGARTSHGATKPVTNTSAPAAVAPQLPRVMPGKDHQGMTK